MTLEGRKEERGRGKGEEKEGQRERGREAEKGTVLEPGCVLLHIPDMLRHPQLQPV